MRYSSISLVLLLSALLVGGRGTTAAGRPAPAPAAPKTDATVIRLGGSADQVRCGAGGRLLIFHLKDTDKLTIVDVVAGKVLKQIPAPGDFHYAADRDKLLLVLNNQRVIQRWDLKTLEREKTVLLPDDRPIRLVSMGSAGIGPLAVWPANKVEFFDVATLKPLTVNGEVLDAGQGTLWPSADGLTFAAWGWTTGPFHIMQLSNVMATTVDCKIIKTPESEDYNESWAMPSADGSRLIRHGARVCDLSTPEPASIEPGPLKGSTLLPTEDPRFLLGLRRTDPYKPEGNTCAIIAAADLRVLYVIRDVEPDTGGQIGTLEGRLGPEPRAHYLPTEKLFITVPESNDQVVVHKFDLKSALDATGADYLFVVSKPPTRVNPGEAYSYQIETLGSSAGVRYKLEDGPKGMTVSDKGLIAWPHAMAGDSGKVGIIVDVSDASGQELQHVISLNVMSGNAPAVAAAGTVAAAPAAPPAAAGGAAARLRGVWIATPAFDDVRIRALLAGKGVNAAAMDAAVAQYRRDFAGLKLTYAFNEDGTATGSFGSDAGKAHWQVSQDTGKTARITITPESGKPDVIDVTFIGSNHFHMSLPDAEVPVRNPITFSRSNEPAPKVKGK